MDSVIAIAEVIRIIEQCTQYIRTLPKWSLQMEAVDTRLESFFREILALEHTHLKLKGVLEMPFATEVLQYLNDTGTRFWTQTRVVLEDCHTTMVAVSRSLERISESVSFGRSLKRPIEPLTIIDLARCGRRIQLLNSCLLLSLQIVSISMTIQLLRSASFKDSYPQLKKHLFWLQRTTALAKIRRNSYESLTQQDIKHTSLPPDHWTILDDSNEEIDDKLYRNLGTHRDKIERHPLNHSISTTDNTLQYSNIHGDDYNQRKVTDDQTFHVQMDDLNTVPLTPLMSQTTVRLLDATETKHKDAPSLAQLRTYLEDMESDEYNMALGLVLSYINSGQSSMAESTEQGYTAAIESFNEALGLLDVRRFRQKFVSMYTDVKLLLAQCCLNGKRYREAFLILDRLVEDDLYPQPGQALPVQRLEAQHLLGKACLGMNDLDKAEQYSLRAFKGRRKYLSKYHIKTLESLQLVIDIYQAMGKNARVKAYSIFFNDPPARMKTKFEINSRQSSVEHDTKAANVGKKRAATKSSWLKREVGSIPSLSSDYTNKSLLEKYRDDVKCLVEIFCSQQNFGPDYSKLLERFGAQYFRRIHVHLLRYYFKSLMKEARNELQRKTVRNLRYDLHEITSLILNNFDHVTRQSDVTEVSDLNIQRRQQIEDRKEEIQKDMKSWPSVSQGSHTKDTALKVLPVGYKDERRDTHQSDSSDSSDGAEDSKELPLEDIQEFLTCGKAFKQTRMNLRKLLEPPNDFAEALQSQSGFVVMQFVYRNYRLLDEAIAERLRELRTQGFSDIKIGKILLNENDSPCPNDFSKPSTELRFPTQGPELSISESCSTRCKSDTTIHPVYKVSFKCACGALITDRYTELKPGGIAKLLSDLNKQTLRPRHDIWRRFWQTCIATLQMLNSDGSLGDQPTEISAAANSNVSIPNKLSAAITTSPADMTALQTNVHSATNSSYQGSTSSSMNNTTAASVQTPSNTSSTNILYLLLCFPKYVTGFKLYHEVLPSNTVKNDRDMFELLRQAHLRRRKFVSFWLGLRTVTKIYFTAFDVDYNNYVDLKPHLPTCSTAAAQSCVLPPPSLLCPPDPEYSYAPESQDYCPPRGPAYMAHYFQHPEEVHEQQRYILEQIPKHLRGQLCVASNGPARGWGLSFEEGLNYWPLVITLLLPSLVIGIVWSVLKRDVQGGFGVAAYCVSAEAILLMYFLSPTTKT